MTQSTQRALKDHLKITQRARQHWWGGGQGDFVHSDVISELGLETWISYSGFSKFFFTFWHLRVEVGTSFDW